MKTLLLLVSGFSILTVTDGALAGSAQDAIDECKAEDQVLASKSLGKILEKEREAPYDADQRYWVSMALNEASMRFSTATPAQRAALLALGNGAKNPVAREFLAKLFKEWGWQNEGQKRFIQLSFPDSLFVADSKIGKNGMTSGRYSVSAGFGDLLLGTTYRLEPPSQEELARNADRVNAYVAQNRSSHCNRLLGTQPAAMSPPQGIHVDMGIYCRLMDEENTRQSLGKVLEEEKDEPYDADQRLWVSMALNEASKRFSGATPEQRVALRAQARGNTSAVATEFLQKFFKEWSWSNGGEERKIVLSFNDSLYMSDRKGKKAYGATVDFDDLLDGKVYRADSPSAEELARNSDRVKAYVEGNRERACSDFYAPKAPTASAVSSASKGKPSTGQGSSSVRRGGKGSSSSAR